MTQEVMYETGKRKPRANKGGKAGEQAGQQAQPTTADEQNSPGWEEQLWMNEAETATTGRPAQHPDNAPSVELLQEQWGNVRNRLEDGLQSLLNRNQLSGSADALRTGLHNAMNDERSREELKRWSALVGGGFLALWGVRRSLGSLTLMTVGAGLVYYALTGQWLIPGRGQPRRRSSASYAGRIGTTTLDSNRPMTTKNIIVKAPIDAVYQAWANFENFPNFMQHICTVTKTGDRTSHWVMEGPLNSRIEWDAETTRLEENKRVAWSSTNGDIKTSGQVTFNELPNDEVEVTVMLRYIPPGGVVGDLVASLFADPEGKLQEDLYNFKRYIEKPENATETAGTQ
ncbi:MAG: SRPBCC family protein [Caldilinea sp. CFX5]|nr:SRPBCC family protein [Caldilinea sp. CFX5]